MSRLLMLLKLSTRMARSTAPYVICTMPIVKFRTVMVNRAGLILKPFGNGALVKLIAGGYATVLWSHIRAATEDECEEITRDWLGMSDAQSRIDHSALSDLRSSLNQKVTK